MLLEPEGGRYTTSSTASAARVEGTDVQFPIVEIPSHSVCADGGVRFVFEVEAEGSKQSQHATLVPDILRKQVHVLSTGAAECSVSLVIENSEHGPTGRKSVNALFPR